MRDYSHETSSQSRVLRGQDEQSCLCVLRWIHMYLMDFSTIRLFQEILDSIMGMQDTHDAIPWFMGRLPCDHWLVSPCKVFIQHIVHKYSTISVKRVESSLHYWPSYLPSSSYTPPNDWYLKITEKSSFTQTLLVILLQADRNCISVLYYYGYAECTFLLAFSCLNL